MDYSKPTPAWPPADLILVAPATLNTVNKFVAGIAHSVALSLLTECFGLDVPGSAALYEKLPLQVEVLTAQRLESRS